MPPVYLSKQRKGLQRRKGFGFGPQIFASKILSGCTPKLIFLAARCSESQLYSSLTSLNNGFAARTRLGQPTAPRRSSIFIRRGGPPGQSRLKIKNSGGRLPRSTSILGLICKLRPGRLIRIERQAKIAPRGAFCDDGVAIRQSAPGILRRPGSDSEPLPGGERILKYLRKCPGTCHRRQDRQCYRSQSDQGEGWRVVDVTGGAVNVTLGDARQGLIGSLFLAENFVEQACHFLEPQRAGERNQ